MKQEQLRIRSKSPDFNRFCQYKLAGLEKSLLTINPLTLAHLLPDKVIGRHFSLKQKAEILETGCCLLGDNLPLFLSIKPTYMQIEYKNDGLLNAKKAVLRVSDCQYFDPCPHRFRINNFQPSLKNYLFERREDLLKGLPNFEVKRPPSEALIVLPDLVLGHELSEVVKEELIRYQIARLSIDQVLYLNLEKNSVLVLPVSSLGKPDTFSRTYPVLARADVSFSWEMQETRKCISTDRIIQLSSIKHLSKGNDFSING